MIHVAADAAGALAAWELAHAHRLWLLIPLALALVIVMLRARPPAAAWPALEQARSAGAKRHDPVRLLSVALRGLALCLLAFAIADPVRVHRAPPEPGHGLDVVLVVDASGSMQAVDTRIGGERTRRIDLARKVIARFTEQRVADGDRVALVVFGESAFTACPLTTDRSLLSHALERVEVGIAGDATALGNALALGVKRALAGDPEPDAASPVAGRVVVLLTDGRNNAGHVPVDVATQLARGAGVRVHTVGIGTAGRAVPVLRRDTDAPLEVDFERHDVDAESLSRIATATGGHTFAARNADQLRAIYRDIDAMERVPRRLPPRIRRAPNPEPLLAGAGLCLLLEIAWIRVWRRRIP